jgi:hypothetical protein
LEGPRDDVLGVAVHPGAVLARLLLNLGPCGREAFVGHAPQQEGVGGGQLVELELVALCSAVDLEGPASSVGFPGASRVFDDALQRHELRHDHPSHRDLL